MQDSPQIVPRSGKHGKEHHLLDVRLVPNLARRDLLLVIQQASRNVRGDVELLFIEMHKIAKAVELV